MFFFNHKRYALRYSLVFILVMLAFVMVFTPFNRQGKEENQIGSEKQNGEKVQEVNINTNKETNLRLITHFVVGDDLVESKTEKYISLEELQDRYSDWEMTEIEKDSIVMERYVEDMSPACKNGAYFGLSPDGYLTLYRDDGEKNEVIETFFRIDVKSLESGLPQEPVNQLYVGIPIEDLAEFNSVLSTFSEYAID